MDQAIDKEFLERVKMALRSGGVLLALRTAIADEIAESINEAYERGRADERANIGPGTLKVRLARRRYLRVVPRAGWKPYE